MRYGTKVICASSVRAGGHRPSKPCIFVSEAKSRRGLSLLQCEYPQRRTLGDWRADFRGEGEKCLCFAVATPDHDSFVLFPIYG